MRICLDLRMVGPRMSGIPRFALNLADELLAQAPDAHFLLLTGGASLDRLAGRPNAEIVRTDCPPYSLREQFHLPRLLRRLSPDLFHAPTYAAPLRRPCPMVMTIFDLIPMRFPAEYRLRHRLYYPLVVRRAARGAACVTTTSECSRSDICALLGVEPSRIVVVPCGVEPRFFRQGATARVSAPYLLAMGNEKPHKDMGPALEAFERLAPGRDIRLVLVGNLSEAVRRRVDGSPFASRIRAESYVTDDRLAQLYGGAAVFMFPSRYEGFGLPPLEAMASGTPAVAFDTPAVVETCADAALYAAVGDARALADAVEAVLDDGALRARLVAAGRERAARFTWAQTARRMLEVYRRVLA